MSRVQSAICFIVVVCLFTGCQSRCNQPCGNWFAGNTRIAPPATYSLNIPNVAQNQPYYQPTAGSNQNGAPAGRTADSLWRRSDGSANPQGNPQGNTQNANGTNRFVDASRGSNSLGQSVLVNSGQPPARTASNTQLPASGSSFTDSRNFATTINDERNDSTRIPVTDATSVRAPAQNFVANGAGQTFALNGRYQPTYSANGYILNNNGASPYYQAAPVVVSNAGNVPFQSQPVMINPTANPSVNQVGWRGRDSDTNRRR
ncbi:MAG: hypothetical protein AAFN77_23160 [Planctomycetota bacterium]